MGSVATQYRHVRKVVSAGKALDLPGTTLKWYEVHRTETPVPAEVDQEARDFLAAEVTAGRLSIGDELGFAILHRVGDAHLLLLCTWRNENELWETVYGKDKDGFGLIEYPTQHRGTYCVWELGAVLHEQQAWIKYLFSERDEQARLDYLDDLPASTMV